MRLFLCACAFLLFVSLYTSCILFFLIQLLLPIKKKKKKHKHIIQGVKGPNKAKGYTQSNTFALLKAQPIIDNAQSPIYTINYPKELCTNNCLID